MCTSILILRPFLGLGTCDAQAFISYIKGLMWILPVSIRHMAGARFCPDPLQNAENRPIVFENAMISRFVLYA